jgi:hypothetical protein
MSLLKVSLLFCLKFDFRLGFFGQFGFLFSQVVAIPSFV